MKKLIIVNGTMGSGKSAVSHELLKILTPGVRLDGDWCWNMNPFVVNEENKRMVTGNITHLLRSFLTNSSFEYVIFCWVIHEESIFNDILAPLSDLSFELHRFTLTCPPEVLTQRLTADVERGIRSSDVIERSLARIPLYDKMSTQKIDVSDILPCEAAEKIKKQICN